MAQYYSLETTPSAPYPVSGVGLGGRTTHHARGEFTPTAAITTADVIDMCDIPPRSRIVGATLKCEGQIDSNGIVRLPDHRRQDPHQARPERERGHLRCRSEDRPGDCLHC
jgi:hypothetical protein